MAAEYRANPNLSVGFARNFVDWKPRLGVRLVDEAFAGRVGGWGQFGFVAAFGFGV